MQFINNVSLLSVAEYEHLEGQMQRDEIKVRIQQIEPCFNGDSGLKCILNHVFFLVERLALSV